MSLVPTPSPSPVGAEEEGGTSPPGSPTPLQGHCSGCHRVLSVRQLNMVINHGTGETGLLCGPCFVDGVS